MVVYNELLLLRPYLAKVTIKYERMWVYGELPSSLFRPLRTQVLTSGPGPLVMVSCPPHDSLTFHGKEYKYILLIVSYKSAI